MNMFIFLFCPCQITWYTGARPNKKDTDFPVRGLIKPGFNVFQPLYFSYFAFLIAQHNHEIPWKYSTEDN